jgi:CubicO group peptidase (beta-lactamase class C family)
MESGKRSFSGMPVEISFLRVKLIIKSAYASIRVIIAVLMLTPSSQFAQITLPVARIDSVFADVDKPDSPGCELVVIHKGNVIYSRGYGYANLDYSIPLDNKSVLHTGSISKQFVAAAVLKASIQGHLNLDDDIRKWLPEFPDYGHPITIRHLIHHTSGIRDELQLRAVGNLPEDINRKEIIELLSRQRALNFKPGDLHLYSNAGYLLMIEIIERATKMSIQEYLSQEFFEPLDMTSAYYGRYPGAVSRASMSYARGRDGFDRVSHVAEIDGVRINAIDMTHWINALSSDRLGSRGFQKLQLQKGVLNKGDSIPYAFGLNVTDHRGFPVIWHGGSASGYRAGMAIYPKADLALFSMCNLSNIDAVKRIWKVAEILLEGQMEPSNPEASGGGYQMPWPAPEGEAIQLSHEQLEELEGRYFAPELDVYFSVRIEGEGLKVGPKGWMRPMTPTSVSDQFTDGRGWAQIRFKRDADGSVTGFVMDIGRVNGLIMEKSF